MTSSEDLSGGYGGDLLITLLTADNETLDLILNFLRSHDPAGTPKR